MTNTPSQWPLQSLPGSRPGVGSGVLAFLVTFGGARASKTTSGAGGQGRGGRVWTGEVCLGTRRRSQTTPRHQSAVDPGWTDSALPWELLFRRTRLHGPRQDPGRWGRGTLGVLQACSVRVYPRTSAHTLRRVGGRPRTDGLDVTTGDLCLGGRVEDGTEDETGRSSWTSSAPFA